MIAEVKDVHFDEIQEVESGKGTAVRFKGLVLHSSLVVKQIEVEASGDAALVKIYLGVTRPGKTGRFSFEVSIGNGVKKILFGSSAEQVWPASASQ